MTTGKKKKGDSPRGKGGGGQQRRPSGPTTEAGTSLVVKPEEVSLVNEEATATSAADHAADPTTGMGDALTGAPIVVQMLPVGQLRPSAYNPNEMIEEQLREFEKEVERLRLIPKPIVVRKVEGGYEVVDGEHSLKVALKLGMEVVPCQVITADDFEARHQTHKRNQHGQMNPVKHGRMFAQMKTLRSLSNRELAAAINVPEANIRIALLYPKAAEVRNCYAPSGKADEQIAKLSVRQVKAYLELPSDKRDLWVDNGAQLSDLSRFAGSAPAQAGEDAQLKDEGTAPNTPDTTPASSSSESSPPSDRPASSPQAEATDSSSTAQGDATLSDDQKKLNALERAWEKAGTKIQRQFVRKLAKDAKTAQDLRSWLKPPKRSPKAAAGATSK